MKSNVMHDKYLESAEDLIATMMTMRLFQGYHLNSHSWHILNLLVGLGLDFRHLKIRPLSRIDHYLLCFEVGANLPCWGKGRVGMELP